MRRLLVCGAVLLLAVAGCAKRMSGLPPSGGLPPMAPTTSAPASPRPVVCTAGDLTVSLGASEGTAGTMYRALVFTNSGGRACVIQGFPGVSFVAGDDGRQVGEAATRTGAKGAAVVLTPGATVTASVGFRDVMAFDPAVCRLTDVRGLRVYPPHGRKAVFVPFATRGCAGVVPGGQLTVAAVRAGAGLGAG